jgi:hypothetical protein
MPGRNKHKNNNDNKNGLEGACPTKTLEARACWCVASLLARIACEQLLDQARKQLQPNANYNEIQCHVDSRIKVFVTRFDGTPRQWYVLLRKKSAQHNSPTNGYMDGWMDAVPGSSFCRSLVFFR